MQLKHVGFVIAICGLLAACGSSHSIVKPIEKPGTLVTKFHLDNTIDDHSGAAVPSHFLAAVRGYLEADLKQRNLLAADNEVAPHVHINVTSYRMRSGFSRAMFGLMAGKDGLASKVTVLAPGGDDHVLGESDVSTFNVAAIGGEEDIARMHAGEIAKFLVGENAPSKK